MYIRFVVYKLDADSRQKLGIFQVAIDLLRWSDLPQHEAQILREELDWFNEHLPRPDRLGDDGTERALSWFRGESTEAVRRARQMAAVLEEHGYLVQMLKTRDPGTVLYSDPLQVVAFPPRGRPLTDRLT